MNYSYHSHSLRGNKTLQTLHHEERSASVEAETACSLFEINRGLINELIRSNPRVLGVILRLCRDRLINSQIALLEWFTNIHLFRPEGDEMRILSGSPMKYFYRREVEQIAYKHAMVKEEDKQLMRLIAIFRDNN